MTIELEKEIARNLIETKLIRVRGLIQDILNRWSIQSTKEFLKKARDGRLPESENDAIELRQLLLEEEKLINLLSKVQ